MMMPQVTRCIVFENCLSCFFFIKTNRITTITIIGIITITCTKLEIQWKWGRVSTSTCQAPRRKKDAPMWTTKENPCGLGWTNKRKVPENRAWVTGQKLDNNASLSLMLDSFGQLRCRNRKSCVGSEFRYLYTSCRSVDSSWIFDILIHKKLAHKNPKLLSFKSVYWIKCSKFYRPWKDFDILHCHCK